MITKNTKTFYFCYNYNSKNTYITRFRGCKSFNYAEEFEIYERRVFYGSYSRIRCFYTVLVSLAQLLYGQCIRLY